jgi:hypothetical protein
MIPLVGSTVMTGITEPPVRWKLLDLGRGRGFSYRFRQTFGDRDTQKPFFSMETLKTSRTR